MNILLYKKETVLAGLRKSLQPFGVVLDIRIFSESASKLFMGADSAVLDTGAPPRKDMTSWAKLTHTIN
ncbi:MAG: hypothetical protein EXX96DRAFT_505128 [Benjaminiella poitrasii]|nr:MAG: hypothetical protein EXX96DRAFT_505128 [Benjaminiella poitrasii]